MNTKIKCNRCNNSKEVELKNPIFLEDEHTEYCSNCETELAYVEGDSFMPKYNCWLIRSSTAIILNK